MKITTIFTQAKSKFKSLQALGAEVFVKDKIPGINAKREINFRSIKILGALIFVIFLLTILLIPDDPPIEFSQKSVDSTPSQSPENQLLPVDKNSKSKSHPLWGSPVAKSGPSLGRGIDINYNTPMLITQPNGNAKTELRAGARIAARLSDKTIISQDSVPVLAVVEFDATSDSGLRLPQGSKLYGEASFEKGSERARIHFTQVSLPSGEIRPISGAAIGRDGQTGVGGRVLSDGVKNTTGQLLTTFISGFATGSMQTGFLGASQGGVKNGLLSAVGQTAQGRAQSYGEKLKTEREWIELQDGTEFDAVLNETLNLKPGGGDK